MAKELERVFEGLGVWRNGEGRRMEKDRVKKGEEKEGPPTYHCDRQAR